MESAAVSRENSLGQLQMQLPSSQSSLGHAKLEDRLDSLAAALKSFIWNGRKTQTFTQDGLTYFVNEYWTQRQRRGHSLHEVSYRACFKAELPEFFIHRLTEPGEWVHDPFMGRGTTPLQAALMGRLPSGNDINPLSSILLRPRLLLQPHDDVYGRISSLEFLDQTPANSELLAFFHPDTLSALEQLRDALIEPDDVVDEWIRMVAINRLTGHSTGFFSGRSLPPNQAVSVKSQLKINERLGQEPPFRDVRSILAKKTRSLLRSGHPPACPDLRLATGPADSTSNIDDASVALVVTSPPFLDVVDYAADNWLRCWFADVDVTDVPISTHRKEEAWTGMVHDVLREQARVVASGRFVVFEVGEVRGGKVCLERNVKDAVQGLPFEVVGVMINQQSFTKTANIWGVTNDKKGTNSNRLVLLRRH